MSSNAEEILVDRSAANSPGQAGPTAGDGRPGIPGHCAYIWRCNASDGSMSKHSNRCRSERSAFEEAAQKLADLRLGAPYMHHRTYHVDLARVPYDRHRPVTGMAMFERAAERCGGFMTGNVSSDVQFSNHIRPVTQRQCNGFTFEAGALRQADMRPFEVLQRQQGGAVPRRILAELSARPGDTLILYKLFHRKSTGGHDVHGWVLTGAEGQLVAVVDKEAGGWARRCAHSDEVMRQAVAAFTHETIPGSAVPLLRINEGREDRVHPEVDKMARQVVEQAQAQRHLTHEDERSDQVPRPRGG